MQSNNVTFNDKGIRQVHSLTIYQYLKSNGNMTNIVFKVKYAIICCNSYLYLFNFFAKI